MSHPPSYHLSDITLYGFMLLLLEVYKILCDEIIVLVTLPILTEEVQVVVNLSDHKPEDDDHYHDLF